MHDSINKCSCVRKNHAHDFSDPTPGVELPVSEAEGAEITGVIACVACCALLVLVIISDLLTSKEQYLYIKSNLKDGWTTIKDLRKEPSQPVSSAQSNNNPSTRRQTPSYPNPTSPGTNTWSGGSTVAQMTIRAAPVYKQTVPAPMRSTFVPRPASMQRTRVLRTAPMQSTGVPKPASMQSTGVPRPALTQNTNIPVARVAPMQRTKEPRLHTISYLDT